MGQGGYLNLSMDVERLFKAVKSTLPLRLLFDGPPRDGKMGLAARMVRHIGKDLLEIRTSELLSKYVGDTEK